MIFKCVSSDVQNSMYTVYAMSMCGEGGGTPVGSGYGPFRTGYPHPCYSSYAPHHCHLPFFFCERSEQKFFSKTLNGR